jgi:hypothetical protein
LQSSRRPRLLFWFGLGVVGFALSYLVRLVLSFVQPDLPLSVPPWYLPLTGAIWCAAGSTAAFGLFRGLSWAPGLMRWGAVAYALWYWSDRIFLACSDYLQLTWPVALVITLLAILCIFWIFSRPKIRSYFGERPS